MSFAAVAGVATQSQNSPFGTAVRNNPQMGKVIGQLGHMRGPQGNSFEYAPQTGPFQHGMRNVPFFGQFPGVPVNGNFVSMPFGGAIPMNGAHNPNLVGPVKATSPHFPANFPVIKF